MLPAHEHPDTEEVVADVIFARIAIAFTFLTIIVPAAAALLR